MRLSLCVACRRPVLELEGQFQKLDSQSVDDGALLATAGSWHARCLVDSEVAQTWYDARLRNVRDVRGHQVLAELPDWTIVRDPGSGAVLALGRQGELKRLSLGSRKSARNVTDGAVFPSVHEAFHLELDDAEIVTSVKEELAMSGTYPLPTLFVEMGIADTTVRPVALARGVFRLEPSLQQYWGTHAVSVRAEYGVFVPHDLLSYVAPLVR